MDTNEVKKFLYKNPMDATLVRVNKKAILYAARIEDVSEYFTITFTIPLGDIENGYFLPKMAAKGLIRWLDDHREPLT